MKGQVAGGDGVWGIFYTRVGPGPSRIGVGVACRMAWSPQLPSPSSRGLTPSQPVCQHGDIPGPPLLHAQNLLAGGGWGDTPLAQHQGPGNSGLPGTPGSQP